MARFNIDEAKNYGTGGNSIFFSLKDHKDSARVRFLFNDIDELYGVSCHEVQDGNIQVDVECLRTYDEPVEKCPLCAAGYQMRGKLFIPLYNEDLKKSQVWTRGKTYFDKFSELCARYNPLVGTSFEIVRHGKKGDTNTTYEIFAGRNDDARVSDYPKLELENNAFLVKTKEEMEDYLSTGTFNNKKVATNNREPATRQIPMRRTPQANSDEEAF